MDLAGRAQRVEAQAGERTGLGRQRDPVGADVAGLDGERDALSSEKPGDAWVVKKTWPVAPVDVAIASSSVRPSPVASPSGLPRTMKGSPRVERVESAPPATVNGVSWFAAVQPSGSPSVSNSQAARARETWIVAVALALPAVKVTS